MLSTTSLFLAEGSSNTMKLVLRWHRRMKEPAVSKALPLSERLHFSREWNLRTAITPCVVISTSLLSEIIPLLPTSEWNKYPASRHVLWPDVHSSSQSQKNLLKATAAEETEGRAEGGACLRKNWHNGELINFLVLIELIWLRNFQWCLYIGIPPFCTWYSMYLLVDLHIT